MLGHLGGSVGFKLLFSCPNLQIYPDTDHVFDFSIPLFRPNFFLRFPWAGMASWPGSRGLLGRVLLGHVEPNGSHAGL